MKLVSFIGADGQAGYGFVEGTRVQVPDAAFRSRYGDLRAVIAAQALDALAAAARPGPDLAEVSLLSPLPNPDKILCIGLNYTSHILETGRDRPSHPSVFTRYPSSVVGHGAPLIRPAVSDWFDFEGELAVIIGTPGRNIAPADAMAHVLGYSCFNDGSVRDYQRHTSQFWPGKNFVASGSMGPWIVTDAGAAIGDWQLETRLNGAVMQSAPISDLAFSIPELIAYLSIVTELLPGDIIATGTPGGVGLFREPKLFMVPGDVVEVSISGIGTLRNQVAAQG